MNLKKLKLNKVNVLVGYPKYIKEFLDILINSNVEADLYVGDLESDLHFSEYKGQLTTILKEGGKPPYIFTTQSKEILEILASLLDKKENIVNVINIYKNKSGDLKFFILNQKEFISNIETNNELRD